MVQPWIRRFGNNWTHIPETPPTRPILNKLEPITFPKSIEVSSFLINAIDAANSGRLVPMAIRVKPISSLGIPANSAGFWSHKRVIQIPSIIELHLLQSSIELLGKNYSLVSFSVNCSVTFLFFKDTRQSPDK